MNTIKSIIAVKGYDLIVLSPSTPVLQTVELMAEINVGTVVIGNDGQVLGIFTERDLLRRVVGPGLDPAALTLWDVMSSPVKYCSLQDGLRKCAELFDKTQIRHLVVAEEGILVGLISQRDILRTQLRNSRDQFRVLQDQDSDAEPQLTGVSGNSQTNHHNK